MIGDGPVKRWLHASKEAAVVHGATVENTIPRDMGFLRIGVASKELVASRLWAMIDGSDRGARGRQVGPGTQP